MYNIRIYTYICIYIYLQIYNGISQQQRSVNKTNKWRVRIIFINLPPLLFCLSITLIGRKSDIDIESKDIYRIYIHMYVYRKHAHCRLSLCRSSCSLAIHHGEFAIVVVVVAIVIACAWRVLPCNCLDNN